MNKKHYANNLIYSSISIIIIITFIYTTIIEYTTTKITNVEYYLSNYGIGLIICNIIFLLIINLLIKKSDKLKKFDVTIVLVFLLIWIITTLTEYIAHYIIDVNYHKLLWDYSKDFFNINRRVNWDASRNFAIGGTLLLYTIQKYINNFLKNSKLKTKIIICLIIGIPMIIDLIV